jgi:hypothetical protein
MLVERAVSENQSIAFGSWLFRFFYAQLLSSSGELVRPKALAGLASSLAWASSLAQPVLALRSL